jgi:hypothetical protein
MTEKKWFENIYRMNLVDMHIEDWNKVFLSKFDSSKYVEMLKLGNFQTAMIYANSHVGYCYWPTKTGKMHEGIKGRDIFGELVELCHKEDLSVIAYYSSIYNNWAYEKNISWRTVDLIGEYSRDEGKLVPSSNRYGICCPNNEQYRSFVLSQLEEIIKNYKFEGIFIDMTFWPVVCYCESCKKRYKKEVGKELPTIINWDDNEWNVFQYKRCQWLNEYANLLTGHIKKINSKISVQHNYALATAPWIVGVDAEFSDAHDYLGGDRYGGFLDQSFICKLFYNQTKNMPFQYASSRCQPSLIEHTTLKSEDMLKTHIYLSMAHGGSFLFIDAIEPAGVLNRKVYERIGKVFNKSKEYEQYLGGNLIEDVVIYFSFDSKIDRSQNGSQALQYFGDIRNLKIPHIDSAIGVAKKLKGSHTPFGVISIKMLSELSKYKTVILPFIEKFRSKEVNKFKQYVKQGGNLYISGKEGVKAFQDILGVKYLKLTDEERTYMGPTIKGKDIFSEASYDFPLSIDGKQVIVDVNNDDTCNILAKIVLPYTDPKDGKKFASIHSNPPGLYTDYPAVIQKKYGKGEVIWSSFPIESIDNEAHSNTFINLINKLYKQEYSVKSDAPEEIEITLFQQKYEKRQILNIVNMQDKPKVLPIYNFTVSVLKESRKIKDVLLLPDKKQINYRVNGNYIDLKIDKLNIFKMISIDFL